MNGGVRRAAASPGTHDTQELAASAKAYLAAGDEAVARDCFAELVGRLQRRASRLALYYLRDRADADEAVQDAFVRAFIALASFDERLSFDVWFTRILVNGCLDRLKARGRRGRWLAQPSVAHDGAAAWPPDAAADGPTPEQALLRAEARRAVHAAIDALPDRQRTVVVLTQLDGRPTAEVSALTGMSESTVRVHLFRAMRRLRAALGRLAQSEATPVSQP
jgi:RNA polymerase sigma-70 factor (ECF subfamily)